MLKITSKEYEIIEKIQLTKEVEGKEEIVYEFDMKITNEEMLKIKHILFDYTEANLKKYFKATKEEREELEIKAEEEIKKNDELFEDICFKEHKQRFKELAGEYKFEEMKGIIKGFLLGFFTDKQISQMNTSITNLAKITNKFQNYK